MTQASELGIGVAGATGRTGGRVVAACLRDPELRLVLALASPTSSALGSDAGELVGHGAAGVPVTADLREEVGARPDVLIDFSVPSASARLAGWAAEHGVALVIATTGHDAAELEAVRAAGQRVPLVLAPNTSPGVAVLARALRLVARSLDASFDVELVDVHHRTKRDAPSGTARALAAIVDAERERPTGISSLRLGGVPGDHTVHFAAQDETLSLTHRALDRTLFATGALRAARWIAGREAGVYSMDDVLFAS